MSTTPTGTSWDSMVLPLLQTVGTGLTVAGDLSTGAGSAEASRFNAGLNDENANLVLSQGADAVTRQQRVACLMCSAGRAAIGGSGVRMDGSALDVLEDSAMQAELEKQTIQYNSRIKALGYRNSAALDRMKADTAERNGYMKAAADGILGAAGAYGLISKLPGTGTPIPESVGGGSVGAEVIMDGGYYGGSV